MINVSIPHAPKKRQVWTQVFLRCLLGLIFSAEWISYDALQNGRASDLSCCIHDILRHAKKARDGSRGAGRRVRTNSLLAISGFARTRSRDEEDLLEA